MNITKSYRKYLKAILKYCEEKACKKNLDEQDLKILAKAIKCQLEFSKKMTYFQEFKQKYPSLYKKVILKYQVPEKITEPNDNSKQNPEEKTDVKSNLIKSAKCTNKNENQERKTELTDRQPRRTEKNGNNNISPEKAVSNDIQNKKLNPNLVCFKNGRIWKLAIQFSDEINRITNLKITQESSEYGSEKINNDRLLLESMANLSIRWEDENKKSSKFFPINNHNSFNPLIFKLRKTDLNFGQQVQSTSSGIYGVIVPDSWQRNVGLSGDTFNEPEFLSIEGYKIHFFDSDNNNSIISFIQPDNSIYKITSQGIRFSLFGNKIKDDNDKIGPLFGEKLPIIRDSQHWDNVSFIVIGEEGEGVGKLRWAIKPMPGTEEIDLRQLETDGTIEIITKSKLSWFFLRIYDKNEEIIESLDFRFVNGLKKIEIPEYSLLPGINGHEKVDIIFYHQKCNIETMNNHQVENINTKRENDRTIAAIPNIFFNENEETYWVITDSQNKRVEVTLTLNRIWWNLSDELKKDLNNLSCQPLELSFNQFKANSAQGIRIWIPGACRGKNIYVGFDKRKRKPFNSKINENSIFIPLREFVDYENIDNMSEPQQLKLWHNADEFEGVAIAQIKLPELHCLSEKCDFKTRDKNEIVQHVKTFHILKYYRILNYEEIRKIINIDWPKEIYKCPYCKYYTNANNWFENPTTAITNHVERCDEAIQNEGRIHVGFHVVRDANEIRENVIKDLPHIYECFFCHKKFIDPNEDELLVHLTVNHEKEIFKRL